MKKEISYGVNNTTKITDNVTAADVRKELFEGDNIVNPKKDSNRTYKKE